MWAGGGGGATESHGPCGGTQGKGTPGLSLDKQVSLRVYGAERPGVMGGYMICTLRDLKVTLVPREG